MLPLPTRDELFTDVRAFRGRHKLSRPALAALLELPNPDRGGKNTVERWENGRNGQPAYLWRVLRDLERDLPPPGP